MHRTDKSLMQSSVQVLRELSIPRPVHVARRYVLLNVVRTDIGTYNFGTKSLSFPCSGQPEFVGVRLRFRPEMHDHSLPIYTGT